jgi:hypothetical protein
MVLAPDQVDELKLLYGEIAQAEEGGLVYLLIKTLVLPPGCTPATSDALLCPMPRDGYDSRLYFASQIQSPTPRNWNGQVRILDRNWFAYSWKLNAAGLRLAQMVQMHVQALR